jgi:hypothetical protein
MAKLVTVVQTYFSDGTYRNNRVEIQIPDEAGELIRKFWNEKGVHNCVKAKFLASNQSATAELFQDETILGGINGMYTEETDENEVFEHSFKDDEEDDRD